MLDKFSVASPAVIIQFCLLFQFLKLASECVRCHINKKANNTYCRVTAGKTIGLRRLIILLVQKITSYGMISKSNKS